MFNKEIGVLFVNSPFKLETLKEKPLKYLIQLATRDGSEHAAVYCKGFIFNMSGEGCEMMTIDKWFKKCAINNAKIHTIETYNDYPNPADELFEYLKSCVGKKDYGIGNAIEAVDFIQKITNFFRKLFGVKIKEITPQDKKPVCSLFIQQAFIKVRLFQPTNDIYSPAELKKALLKSPFFEDRWRRINN